MPAPVLYPPFNVVRLSHADLGVTDLNASRAFRVNMAFANGRGPRPVAFRVPIPLNIIDLPALMAATGYVATIERGPGRHGISNAFFLNVLDRDGHRIELNGSNCQTVDPDHQPIHWDLKDRQRQALWGAPAPRSWFENGSTFAGVATQEPSRNAQPVIAP